MPTFEDGLAESALVWLLADPLPPVPVVSLGERLDVRQGPIWGWDHA
jgi:hypothetical protein